MGPQQKRKFSLTLKAACLAAGLTVGLGAPTPGRRRQRCGI